LFNKTYFVSRPHDLAVAQIPKSALHSIREWLGPEFQPRPPDEAVAVSRRIAFIREPIDRLKSCYSFMRGLKDRGCPHKSGAPLGSWQVFVDHVLSGNINEHWTPQCNLVGDCLTQPIRLTDIDRAAIKILGRPIGRLNQSERARTPDYRAEELKTMYAGDYALLEAAWL
jgi:hypothetical protein